ncbi:hypothetical protein AAFF_G00044290 [Aldrovandia affinis]|uniref:E3 ubiquitin-protein ligase RNF139 n=1 Tax=Aldrovandia affinis TaxID=143900 RepID=A0AAD7S4G1_9TELE|nr:hypothetical protein AAFF_G00044290 [Aldrovandia affinis]
MAVLGVALRVPCIFIIDAIFNSHNHPPWSGWTGTIAGSLIRVLGILVFSVVLVLSQRGLIKVYTLFFAALLGVVAILLNYYATSQTDFHGLYYMEALGFKLLPQNGPALWLGMAVVQLSFGVGYVTLLNFQSMHAALIILNIVAPISGLIAELPVDVRQTVAIASGYVLAISTVVHLTSKLMWLYYFCGYVFVLARHMYRILGMQMLVEDTWMRIRFPDVLRVFWLTRMTARAIILIYAATAVREGTAARLTSRRGVLAFIGSAEEDDKRLGLVAPVLFFILALQTGLSSLAPAERLLRLSRNMCLLLTAVLHFIHGMTDPVLMSLSASHVLSVRRHLPVLLVSLCLFLLPMTLTCALWRHYPLSTWLFAVTAFCMELCVKVVFSLAVYALFMVDGYYGVLWERLDDYVYYARSSGYVLEFAFGVMMFGNGAYSMMFESGNKTRVLMMCLHAYFNIYLQVQSGWKTFINRRTAVKKINSLPEVEGSQLRDIEDVCAICYQEFPSSARVTPCHHYFHTSCLRKWLYIQDTCPMCHQRVYFEEDCHDADSSNNNGYAADDANAGEFAAAVGVDAVAGGGPEQDNELPEDNDSIDYDEDEWGARQHSRTSVEEDYINGNADSSSD